MTPKESSRESELIAQARAQFAGLKRPGPDSHAARRREESRLPADAIEGYEIEGEIHRGGQGIVYRARHVDTGRDVAVKVLREGPFASASDLARFQREARLLGSLRHPHIVTIHDTGRAGEMVYLVTDYIEGRPLDVHVASNRPSPREILELFAKIAEAVNAAHLRGILHRDLKPGNIRIDPDGQPHILDFGLAKRLDAPEDSESEAMTQTGQFVGSLPWASPEQAEGRLDAVDLRTDVYSLGVLLFQMLTGTFPYSVSGGMRTVLDAIVSIEPPPPGRVQSGIDDEVDTIVLKCLRKEPDRRYQSAGELARDIRRYLGGEAIDAKRDSATYVLRKTLRRHRIALGIAAAFFLLVTGSSVALWVLYTDQRAARETAEEATKTAKREANRALDEQQRAERYALEAREKFLLAREAAEFLMNEVSDQLRRFSGLAEVRRSILAEAYARFQVLLDDEGADDEVLHGLANLHYRLGQLAEELGQDENAFRHGDRSIEIARDLVARKPGSERFERVLGWALRVRGYMSLKTGRFEEARGFFDERLAIAQELLADAPDDVHARREEASSVEALTDLADAMRDRELQERYAEQLYRLRRGIYEIDPQNSLNTSEAANALERLFRLVIVKGETDRAEKLASSCLTMRQQLVDADPHDRNHIRGLSNCLEMMAEVAEQRGDVAGNREWSEKMLDAKKEIFRLEPQNHEARSDVATTYTRLALISMAERNLDEAKDWASRAADHFKPLLEGNPGRTKFHRSYVWCLDFLGRVARQQGDGRAAGRHLRELMDVLADATAREDADPILLTAHAMKLLYAEVERLRDPERALELSLRAIERDGGRNYESLQVLAEAYFYTGDCESAIETIVRARDVTPAARKDVQSQYPRFLEKYGAGSEPEQGSTESGTPD